MTGERLSPRRRAALVGGLRRLAREPPAPADSGGERCDLCPAGIGEQHRHLLQLDERRILCVCETCWSMRSGEPEYRPAGNRTLWLADFALDDEAWAGFGIPIGLAFFLRSSVSGGVVALYPSPAGATECELDLGAWERVAAANPILDDLEPDAEGLVVNRLSRPPQYAIAPVDACYRLVGTVKARWEGISGGRGLEQAVGAFFDELRARAAA